MIHDEHRQETIRVLRELIQDIHVAMLTTEQPDGSLRSRPMETLQTEFDGELYFLTEIDSGKVDEIREHQQVNLSYAQPRDKQYVSISGHATVVRDRRKVELLWRERYARWFPEGPFTPNLAIVKVSVEQAEYWDEETGTMQALAGMFRSVFQVESETPPPPRHDRITWPVGESLIDPMSATLPPNASA